MEQIAPSTPSDLAEVTDLLARCGMPTADVSRHFEHFVVARDGARVVGVIGVEVHGARGMLRSLAVAEDHRGRGIARRLYAAALGTAGRLALAELYCMTRALQGFFELLGWNVVTPDEVPREIQESEEYRALAGSAMCMMRGMPRA